MAEPLFDPRANKSVFHIPDSHSLLHVPMMKLLHPRRRAESSAFVLSAANRTRDLSVCHQNCSAAEQLYPAWPARKQHDLVDWPRLGTPQASRLKRCGASSHWYCGHFSANYLRYHQGVYQMCYSGLGVFERPDVRLVLDIGGASAAMAQALHDTFGDRIVTITGAFWSTVRCYPSCH